MLAVGAVDVHVLVEVLLVASNFAPDIYVNQPTKASQRAVARRTTRRLQAREAAVSVVPVDRTPGSIRRRVVVSLGQLLSSFGRRLTVGGIESVKLQEQDTNYTHYMTYTLPFCP